MYTLRTPNARNCMGKKNYDKLYKGLYKYGDNN